MARFQGVKFGAMGFDPGSGNNFPVGRKLHLNATPILADGSLSPGHLTPEQRLAIFGSADESDEYCEPQAIVRPYKRGHGGQWEPTGQALPYTPGTGAEEYINIGSRHDDSGCTPTVKFFKACDCELWVILRDVPAWAYEYEGAPAGEQWESKHLTVAARGDYRPGRGEG